ncbi:unnamed protein product, partial [Arabidopsis halleri]
MACGSQRKFLDHIRTRNIGARAPIYDQATNLPTYHAP